MKSKPNSASVQRATGSKFLIKSEPFKYSWDQFVRDGRTFWDGVRNYEARNLLRSMVEGDECLFYHSNEGKEVVGVARVVREAYPDPTAPGEDWSVVDLEPLYPLPAPVSLSRMRETPALSKLPVFTRPRLSVVRVTEEEFETILRLGNAAGTRG